MTTVLHVIDTTGPGGAETVFLDLAEECIRQGYRSIALIRGSGWVENQLKKRSIPYYIHDCKGSMNFRFLVTLASIVRENKVSLIQSHLLGSGVYSSLVGILTRVPVIATFHGHVDISDKERLRKIKFGAIQLGAKHVVCVTEKLGENVKRSSPSCWKCNPVVIPNGIDMALLERIPLPRSLPSRSRIFGCLGNIRPAKNYLLAIEFIKHLHENGIKDRLLIAGDDTKPLAHELKQKVREFRLEKYVEFLGFIDNTQEFMASIDIFLMSSSSEGHPLALTQAMAAGKPVLSTRSGVEKVIPEMFLFLSDSHTPQGLSVALTNLEQTDRFSELLLEARQFVSSSYSQKTMFERYLNLYEVGLELE